MHWNRLGTVLTLSFISCSSAFSQSITGGTITGVVSDPSGAVVANAKVQIRNPVTGYDRTETSDASGAFRFNNVPQNRYELFATAAGFTKSMQPVEIHSSVPITANISLSLATETNSVTVEAGGALIETEASAHTDTDSATFSKLPDFDPAAGLTSVINNSTGATASDANGMIHPLGDHAQMSFDIDGEPISDQVSKGFSTQFPANAIQSMEIITGAPDAQYGDKSSLVVNATTKSGLGAKTFGSLDATWGSFGTYGEDATLGFGNAKFGNFLAIDGVRTGHFLDTPEFLPIHDIGNNETIFDRIDYQPTGQDSFHLNVLAARNWFQVPNSYDQLTQDQKQRVLTWNVAPGYQHTFGSKTLLTINPFVRRDQVNYYGSRDPFNDTPVTLDQNRFLTNYGVKADISTTRGVNNLKFGTQIQQTRLLENFAFAVTDPAFNPVCLDSTGSSLDLPGITNPSQCSTINPGYQANPGLLPGLVPYDLTRGGSFFNFHAADAINQFAFYVSDEIKVGNLTINAGLRDDEYRGLVQKNGIQPRLGLAYLVGPTQTVLRVAYSRTFETPFNENLLLSSSTGSGGLGQNAFGSNGSTPLEPGARNQFNAGFQQKLGKYLLFDGDYFWKYTHNAYDFDALFNTPLTFPIAWHNSKIDGVTGRLTTTNMHGFQAYMTFGHTRARYFPPEVGGLIFQGTAITDSVFRIDHDQAFQQTTNIRYQRGSDGPWFDFIWRFDSGLVNDSVPDLASAYALTAAEQAAIGFYCGSNYAEPFSPPITSCSTNAGASRVTIPAPGTENDDTNPPRVAPRNLFDVAIGDDNLFHSETKKKVSARLTVTNLTNKIALYNFLSTFSGTHFVAPRTYQLTLGYAF